MKGVGSSASSMPSGSIRHVRGSGRDRAPLAVNPSEVGDRICAHHAVVHLEKEASSSQCQLRDNCVLLDVGPVADCPGRWTGVRSEKLLDSVRAAEAGRKLAGTQIAPTPAKRPKADVLALGCVRRRRAPSNPMRITSDPREIAPKVSTAPTTNQAPSHSNCAALPADTSVRVAPALRRQERSRSGGGGSGAGPPLGGSQSRSNGLRPARWTGRVRLAGEAWLRRRPRAGSSPRRRR